MSFEAPPAPKKKTYLKDYSTELRCHPHPFPCPHCDRRVAPTAFEFHCDTKHSMDPKTECVWCGGLKTWPAGRRRAHADHLLACFGEFSWKNGRSGPEDHHVRTEGSPPPPPRELPAPSQQWPTAARTGAVGPRRRIPGRSESEDFFCDARSTGLEEEEEEEEEEEPTPKLAEATGRGRLSFEGYFEKSPASNRLEQH